MRQAVAHGWVNYALSLSFQTDSLSLAAPRNIGGYSVECTHSSLFACAPLSPSFQNGAVIVDTSISGGTRLPRSDQPNVVWLFVLLMTVRSRLSD